ncbi:TNT domain-containing protein [Paenarthrobacter sp. NPDC090522]|uniref:TNT domain-containing protein n=1 Tax=Paenarthrobacter sp. NPDC090522 TaxID=3364383 RepID=UPI00380AFFB2
MTEQKTGRWNRYLPNDGGVEGSHWSTQDLAVFLGHYGNTVDRVGNEDGSYLCALKNGEPTSFEDRSLPVDALKLPYARYRVAEQWPDGLEGSTVQAALVAPWFGRAGGSIQVLFLDGQGRLITTEELLKTGVLSYDR